MYYVVDRRTLLLLLCGLVLLAGMVRPPTALACTPPPGGLPTYSIAQRVFAADVVLEGLVLSVSGSIFSHQVASVNVYQYLKGAGPATVTIAGFGSSSLCLSQVRAGERLVFFTRGDPAAELQASYLSQFDAVAPANQQTIDRVRAAAGPGIRLPLVIASSEEVYR